MPASADAPDDSDYAVTRDYLYSLKNAGAKYGIDRMRALVAELGHPERRFPAIHVAGTNGKGSVCALLEALYRGNGYTTGLYTSPHLVRQGERVQVNRSLLTEPEICAFTRRLRPVAEKLGAADPDDHPSFFEFMTAMAFLRFAEEPVDIALIETGLGGRLDATNVLEPELSIITSISLDHTEQLGDSLEKIAAEKAGIIKPGVPVLLGKLPPVAEAVIRGIAAQRNSPVFSVVERFPSPEALPTTNLAGSFQRWNAGVALYATELLAERFPVKPERSADILQFVHWQGRWETLPLRDRSIILDASHNPEGAAMLDENLTQLVAQTGRRPIIIAGALGENRGRSLMQTVAKHARALYLIAPQQSRATPTRVLETFLPEARQPFPVFHSRLESLFPSVGHCTVGDPGDTIVVTGSLYLIGEVLERLTCDTPPHQGILQDTP